MASSPLGNILMAKPNERVNLAAIGIGNRGGEILMDLYKTGLCNIVALCDVDMGAKHTEAAIKQFPDVPRFQDFRQMFDKMGNQIDAVTVGVPDFSHFPITMMALDLGKHVYVEKPIGNSIAECDVMVEAANKYNRVVQVGQQQRSARLWKEMIDYLDSGVLGDISRVHVFCNFNYAAIKNRVPDSEVPEGVDFDTWLGPAPSRTFNKQRFHGSWRMFWDYGGGLMTDWGVHLLDMALWSKHQKKMPNSIQATGGNYLYPEGMHETFDTLSVLYQLDDSLLSWENNAGIESGPYGKNYGLIFTGKNGTTGRSIPKTKTPPRKL